MKRLKDNFKNNTTFTVIAELTSGRGYSMDPDTFRSELASRNALENVRQEYRNQKTIDLLVEKADISG